MTVAFGGGQEGAPVEVRAVEETGLVVLGVGGSRASDDSAGTAQSWGWGAVNLDEEVVEKDGRSASRGASMGVLFGTEPFGETRSSSGGGGGTATRAICYGACRRTRWRELRKWEVGRHVSRGRECWGEEGIGISGVG